MTTRLGLILLAACATDTTTSHGAQITGDVCAIHDDAQSCAADTNCLWAELGRPCQTGQPCVSGVCYEPGPGGGSGSGSGSGMAACACPNGGICFEQIGGPAQQSDTDPEIQCATGDTCAAITGQGTCSEDPNVSGLCL